MTVVSSLYNEIKTPNSVSRYFVILSSIVLLLLLIPLAAMQFTAEVNWSIFDFIFAWVLLVGSGMAYKLISRKIDKFQYRVAVGLAVAAALLIVWINGAVGIIGNEDHPANLMYFGVIITGIAGAAVAGLRPKGMAVAMFLTAFAQCMVPVIALMIWKPEITFGVVKVFMLNGVFVVMFAGSGLLFWSAARNNEESSPLNENREVIN